MMGTSFIITEEYPERKAVDRFISKAEKIKDSEVIFAYTGDCRPERIWNAVKEAKNERIAVIDGVRCNPKEISRIKLDEFDVIGREQEWEGLLGRLEKKPFCLFLKTFYLANPFNPRLSESAKKGIFTGKLKGLPSWSKVPHKMFPFMSRKKAPKPIVSMNESLSVKTLMTKENRTLVFWLASLSIILSLAIRSAFGIYIFIASVMTLITAVYLASSLFKLRLSLESLGYPGIEICDEELGRLDERSLPVYTVFAPLYKEAGIVRQLISSLIDIDWPKDRLDIKILLEADDDKTIREFAKWNLPHYFDVMVLPKADIKGKPRALNMGLANAKGKYFTIYDAEDMPDRDQLKKAFIAFGRLPENTICVHSKISFYNGGKNFITKLFSAEFASQYDLNLPALAKLGYVFPFSGNSVHFRTDMVRALGGWDSYNVTEDCEIAARAFRSGYAAACIDSSTREEAASSLSAWIKQRTRWMKGFMQTSLVSLRHPASLYRELGPKGFATFMLTVPAVPFVNALLPISWLLMGLWFAARIEVLKAIFPWFVFFPALASFFLGTFAITCLYFIGCMKRDIYGIIKWCAFQPVYCLMMSLATWRAVYQLVRSPYRWEKTSHGVFRR